MYGNFNTFLGHFSRISQLDNTPHGSCDTLDALPCLPDAGWCLQSNVMTNSRLQVYGTTEPQANFHQRIEFCMQTYDYSLKAMRYPPNAYRSYLESAEDRKKREQEEADIAAEMDEMGDDEF